VRKRRKRVYRQSDMLMYVSTTITTAGSMSSQHPPLVHHILIADVPHVLMCGCGCHLSLCGLSSSLLKSEHPGKQLKH